MHSIGLDPSFSSYIMCLVIFACFIFHKRASGVARPSQLPGLLKVITRAVLVLVSRSQTAFLAQGVIACSISARSKKGSGMVRIDYLFLTPPQVWRC